MLESQEAVKENQIITQDLIKEDLGLAQIRVLEPELDLKKVVVENCQ